MYENIIGQDKVISLLKNDIGQKSLSNSMIFHGPAYTGKLSAALETVRVLNCAENAAPDCQCEHCRQIAQLNFGGMLFLSRRSFGCYVSSFVQAFEKTADIQYFEAARRYIRLLFLPYRDDLTVGAVSESDMNDIRKLQTQAFEIIETNYDALRAFRTLGLETKKKLSDELNKLTAICDDVSSMFKKQNIPVDMIRNALDWSYINQPDTNRVIIIDMADYLDESSRNVLLKRLEEPSPNLFFILIAENKNRIIRTILSRCRCYFFNDISKEDIQTILAKTFGESSAYNSVGSYLKRNDETSYENMLPVLTKLLNYIFNFHYSFGELEAFLQKNNDKNYAKALLKNMSQLVNRELLSREAGGDLAEGADIIKKIATDDLQMLNKILSETVTKMEIYNLTPVWALEGIFYPIKSLVNKGKILC